MPADASIYGMIRPTQPVPGPLDQYAQAMQLKNMMGAGDLQDMQRQAAKRSFDEDAATSEAYRAGGGDPSKVKDLLYGRGLYKPAQAMEKTILDRQKSQAELEKLQVEKFGAAAKNMRDVVAAAASDADMPLVKDAALRLFGPDVAAKMQIPDRFDPAWQQRTVMTGDKLLESLKPHVQPISAGGQTVLRETNPNAPGYSAEPIQHTATPEGLAADARAKDAAALAGRHYDADRGVVVNTQTATTTPVADQAGVPIGPKALPPQQAAQAQMMIQGRQDVKRAKDLLIDKDGAVNRGVLADAQTWGVPGIAALQVNGVPFSQGKDLRSYMMNAVEGKLRLESGAAVPEQEVLRIAQRFIPAMTDSDATIKQKLDRLDEFMAGTLSLSKMPTQKPTTPSEPDKPEAEKMIGRTKYVKIKGQWFENR